MEQMKKEKKEKSYAERAAEESRVNSYVRQRMSGQYNYIKSTIGEYPVVIAPFGSWNYGLQHSGSDMDSYAYMAPTYEDIIFGKKGISQELKFQFDEIYGETPADIISIKNIHDLFKGVAAGSPTALEIINSPHLMYSPYEFGEYRRKLQSLADEVVEKMPFRVLMNLVKMGQNNLKRANSVQLEYNLERKKKQILTAIRAVVMIETYMTGEGYCQNIYYHMLISSAPEKSNYRLAKSFMEAEEENVNLAWCMANNRLGLLEKNIHELYGGVPQEIEQELEAKGKALWKEYVTEKIIIPALQGEYILP